MSEDASNQITRTSLRARPVSCSVGTPEWMTQEYDWMVISHFLTENGYIAIRKVGEPG